jgi:hypothetical protein
MSKQSIATVLPISKRVASRTYSLSLVVFSLVAILFVTLRFWKITSFSLWGGEAFTMIGVKQSWMGLFSYVVADIVHPPLFYVLLKLWIGLGGESLLWLKLFPVLSGVALVMPFYFLCRELNFHLPEMGLALFLAAVNGYMIHYAQELRMYSLFTFLSMCSFWLFMRYFNSTDTTNRKLVVLTLVNLLNIYTHYYGWVVVGMEFLFLSIWQRQKLFKFGLSALILLLIFAPWAYQVIRKAQSIGGLDRNLDWIPKPHAIDVLNFYSTLNGPLGYRYLKFAGLMLVLLPVALWFWRILRLDPLMKRSDMIVFSWLVLLSFLPVVGLYFISQRLEQAIWIDRYFIFISLPYFMMVAVAVCRLKPRWITYPWIAAIVLWSLYAGIQDLRTNRMAWEGAQMGSRVKWDLMTKQLIQAEAENSEAVNIYTLTVISKGLRTGDWASSTSLDYFLDSYGIDKFRFGYARDVQALLKRSPGEDHFWIAFFELADWPQPRPTVVLNENGYRVGDPIVFQQMHNRIVLLPVWRK